MSLNKAVVLSLILLFTGTLFFLATETGSGQASASISTEEGKKAVIVDQLGLTKPNNTFIEKASNILHDAGYQVDYIPSQNVTVGFYDDLPNHGYDIIVLRVHGALYASQKGPVDLFTSERYEKSKHYFEQLTGLVGKVTYNDTTGEETYFSVTTDFVSNMNGNFHNTTILFMGCDGLTNQEMGEAFIEKGARTLISWNGPVTASHNDATAIHFLKYFVKEKMTLERARVTTSGEMGPDPVFDTDLCYYPAETDHYRLI